MSLVLVPAEDGGLVLLVEEQGAPELDLAHGEVQAADVHPLDGHAFLEEGERLRRANLARVGDRPDKNRQARRAQRRR